MPMSRDSADSGISLQRPSLPQDVAVNKVVHAEVGHSGQQASYS